MNGNFIIIIIGIEWKLIVKQMTKESHKKYKKREMRGMWMTKSTTNVKAVTLLSMKPPKMKIYNFYHFSQKIKK